MKFRGFLTVFGACLINMTTVSMYLFGNLNTYIVSYIRATKDDQVHYQDALKIAAVSVMATGIGFLPIVKLARRVGFRVILVFGCVLISGGIIASYVTVQISLVAVVATFGFTSHLGFTVMYTIPSTIGIKWFPENIRIVVIVNTVSTAIGALIFNQVITTYVNPSNISPDNNGFFVDEKVVYRIPSVFIVLGCSYLVLQFIGTLLLKSRRDNEHDDEKGHSTESWERITTPSDQSLLDDTNKPSTSGLDPSSPIANYNEANKDEKKTDYGSISTTPDIHHEEVKNKPAFSSTPIPIGETRKVQSNIEQAAQDVGNRGRSPTDQQSKQESVKSKEAIVEVRTVGSGDQHKQPSGSKDQNEIGDPGSHVPGSEGGGGGERPKNSPLNNENISSIESTADVFHDTMTGEDDESSQSYGEANQEINMSDGQALLESGAKPEDERNETKVAAANEEHFLPNLDVKHVLKNKEFYLWFFIGLLHSMSYFFVLNSYKAFAFTFYRNDQAVVAVGSCASAVAILGRLLWYRCSKCTSYKTLLILKGLINAAFIASFGYTSYGGFPMFSVWIFIIFFMTASQSVISPATITRMFGPKNSVVNHGMVMTHYVFLGIIAVVGYEAVNKVFESWHTLFIVLGILELISGVLALLLPSDVLVLRKEFLQMLIQECTLKNKSPSKDTREPLRSHNLSELSVDNKESPILANFL